MVKQVTRIIYWALIVFIVVIAVIVASSKFPIPYSLHLYTVQSGSMEPAIHTGSLVIAKTQDSYNVGDVITFQSSSGSKTTVSHRINQIIKENSITSYKTKGDANDVVDSGSTPKSLVIGKVIVSIPLVGYLIAFAKTLPGLIILIIIPGILIVFSELMTIKEEAKRLMVERKKRKLTLTEKVEEKIGETMMDAEKELDKMWNEK